MDNYIFSYSTEKGYAIVFVAADGPVTPEITKEAEKIAKSIYNGEEYSSSLPVTEARSFVTDGEPFCFQIKISPDRKSAEIKVSVKHNNEELTEVENLQT